MLIGILAFILLGVLVGVVTGLVPGIHPNTVFVLVVSAWLVFYNIEFIYTLSFIVSLSVTNTFTDFIPSIIFGAPEPDSSLSVLPGHRLLLSGHGYDALFLVTIGGLLAVIFTVFTFPLLLVSLPVMYVMIRPFLHILLLGVALWMVLMEKGWGRLWGLAIFVASGAFGLVTLNSLPSQQALFPALSGLFGVSGLLMSIATKSHIPRQRINNDVKGSWLKGGLAGWLAGMLAGMLPGTGSSQSGVMASQAFRADNRSFLIALGGVNTSNIIFTFIAFYMIGKTRSGAAWAISQFSREFVFSDMVLSMIVVLMAAFISVPVTLCLGRMFLRNMTRISYRWVNLSIISFMVIAVPVLSGFPGLLIMSTATFLGLLAINLKVKRTHMMGFLMVPTILYFAGL